jgi:hypothetical protein
MQLFFSRLPGPFPRLPGARSCSARWKCGGRMRIDVSEPDGGVSLGVDREWRSVHRPGRMRAPHIGPGRRSLGPGVFGRRMRTDATGVADHPFGRTSAGGERRSSWSYADAACRARRPRRLTRPYRHVRPTCDGSRRGGTHRRCPQPDGGR